MEQLSYTGKGVGVALLDTGIYPHIDFKNRIWAFADFVSHKCRPYDDNGHGTHVAGILQETGPLPWESIKEWRRAAGSHL